MVIHSSFKDFILFLYVHMSRADGNYDPKEMATIKTKIGGLFEKEADAERKLYIAIRQYNSFDKSKLTELFEATFKHFGEDTSVLKSNFYSDLNEIILADGKVLHSETKALEALKGIIDLNIEKSAL
jgi:uncharacterized tellurite resistance protein B-like protein